VSGAEVQVDNLSVATSSGRRFLDDIGFTVSPGSVLGVVGASGAGKTTLARALVGHVEPGLPSPA
jgi:peptide/nickel transport system ATP-binding protein